MNIQKYSVLHNLTYLKINCDDGKINYDISFVYDFYHLLILNAYNYSFFYSCSKKQNLIERKFILYMQNGITATRKREHYTQIFFVYGVFWLEMNNKVIFLVGTYEKMVEYNCWRIYETNVFLH